jgi:hypothetical protein
MGSLRGMIDEIGSRKGQQLARRQSFGALRVRVSSVLDWLAVYYTPKQSNKRFI